MKQKKEIGHLIRLLDDEDREIYSQVEEKLLSYGTDAIPLLEDAWGKSLDAVLQERIESIVHRIQFDSLKAEFKIWSINESHNLLKGALLACRYQFPDLDEKRVIEQMEKIKRDVWIELNDNLTALEVVKILNHVIYDIHGLGGNTVNYHAPQNSFINNVLESKRGNPLSLAIIYSVIAQDLHIPIYGVNLPEHFVLAYLGIKTEPEGAKRKAKKKKEEAVILFYINSFSKGAVFSSEDIESFLKQLKVDVDETYFKPCTNIDIMKRLFRNLIYSYEKLGFKEKIDEVNELIHTLEI